MTSVKVGSLQKRLNGKSQVEEGVQQGQRLVIESLLSDKFGSEDVELSRVIDALLQLQPREYTRLCVQLSRDELAARFGS